ncbi:MAG: hypothetical protein IPP52_15065 [Ignavibacteria bacterium]|nr:hypothetical protein [Ignavibacteria bacterium]
MLLLIGRQELQIIYKVNVDENEMRSSKRVLILRTGGWGALIVIERSSGLKNVIETGELIQTRI